MSEKLHIPSHRYETDKYDKGYERTFRTKPTKLIFKPEDIERVKKILEGEE